MQKEESCDKFSQKNFTVFLFKLPAFFRAPGVVYLAFLFIIILDIFLYLFYSYTLWGVTKKIDTVDRRRQFVLLL